VAGALDGGESISVFNFPVASGGAVDVPRLPFLKGGAVEIVEAFLSDSERNGSNINVSGVDEDVQVRAFFEEILVEGEHGGVVTFVGDQVGTSLPVGGSGVDGHLDLSSVKIVRKKGIDGSALGFDSGVLDREIKSGITAAEVLVEIIRVDAGKRKRRRASGSDFLVKNTEFGDGGVVDLQTGDLQVVSVTAVIGPVDEVGIGDKTMPIVQVELGRDGIISTSEDWVSNHEALERSAKIGVVTN
jgi:hypothetical protein